MRNTDQTPRVLLMGHRGGLARALREARIPFVVWSERELKSALRGVVVHVAPFGRGGRDTRSRTEALLATGPFSHVIAGTEAAVVPASHARRVLSARRSVHTTVRKCHDKLAMKRQLREAGIPMTDFLDGNQIENWGSVFAELGSPVVVKDRGASGGKGIDIVRGPANGSVPLRNRIVERFVDAPEASVESLVHGGSVVFENVTEYFENGHVNIVPASVEVDSPAADLRQLSRRAIQALKISWGLTHLEAYRTAQGPLFGEIALRPPGGYIMELLRLAYGFDAWRAFVGIELAEPVDVPAHPKGTAAAIVLHPGPGRVEHIDGLNEVQAHPCVVRARIRVATGDTVEARHSVGAEVGHVLLRADDRPTLLQAIADVRSTLRLVLRADEDAAADG